MAAAARARTVGACVIPAAPKARRRPVEEPPPAGRADIGLFQTGHGRQVELAGHDEGRAAPARAEPAGIDRGEVAREARGMVACEGVAITLVEVGVVVAEI